jgi:hypothetical protein
MPRGPQDRDFVLIRWYYAGVKLRPFSTILEVSLSEKAENYLSFFFFFGCDA